MYYFNFIVAVVEAGKMFGALHALVHLLLHIQFLPIFYQGVQFSRGTMIRKYFLIEQNICQRISRLNMEKHTHSLF